VSDSELLRTIIANQERILARLDAIAPAPAHRDEDDALLLALLPAIVAWLGDAPFTVAQLTDEIIKANDLTFAAAFEACGSTRSIGRLFARNAGRIVDGWCVRRVPNTARPAEWHVSNIRNI
jgi:hypothetical protein